jgi:transposase-like protein
MIAIKPAASWIDVYQLSYREIADMLTIRTVTVNPDHVTE